MNLLKCLIFAGASICIALPAFALPSFSEAEELWKKNKDKPGYTEYQGEFVQYNNHFHLDTKDNCFAKDGPVNMYLIITAQAVVESVVTDIDNEQARCFKHTYTGLRVKAPPFSPLIINMRMQNK
jgi:hypothetical protein